MKKDDILKRLVVIIARQLGVDEEKIVAEANFYGDLADLGADSIDFAEIILSAEEEFGISIPDESLEKIMTVGDLVDVVVSAVEEEIFTQLVGESPAPGQKKEVTKAIMAHLDGSI